MGGVILKAVGLPAHAEPGAVSGDKVRLMGLLVGILVPSLYLIPIHLIGRYRITRQVHSDIRQALEDRRIQKAGAP
jgi:Na+/melibiose symporter-like transporter